MRLFRNDREAFFVSRPNRFVILARDEDEELYCHCPNPGRLAEFAFPGERLILESNPGQGGNAFPPAPASPFSGAPAPDPGNAPVTPPRKTRWTAAAVYHNGAVAPLYASRANGAAAELVLPRIIPSLKNLRAEYAIGGSRFDFFAEDAAGNRHLVEVKACSLVEHGCAMFPDAPSARALKHLEELAALSREGFRTHVLFMILHGDPERFVPNLHTDPAFAAALSRLGSTARRVPPGKAAVHAALLRSTPAGETSLVRADVPVSLDYGGLAEGDRGNYLFVLELPESRDIETGALGTLSFEKGWYVYAGSAARNLSRRVSRHLRKVRKRKHWHIDYLTPFAGRREALPIASFRNLECYLATELRRIGGRAVPRFGCSDCSCEKDGGSHLYHFPSPPMRDKAFVDLLLRCRHWEALRP